MHATGRVSQRAHFVIFSHKGLSPRQIGTLIDYSVNAFKKWLRAYVALGAAARDLWAVIYRDTIANDLEDRCH